jgi:antirestriction protein
MISQDLINFTIACGGAIVGWVLKVIWEAIRSLQEDMREIEHEIHTGYVSKDDYRQDMQEIKDMLQRIFDKIDLKADK